MRDDGQLPPMLERATELLRPEAPVRPEWRAAVLTGLDRDERVSSISARRWSMRPAAAIAAGFLCAMVGAGLAYAATRASQRSRVDLIARNNGSAATPAGLRDPVSRVRFTLVAPNAARVSVVGDFNQWNPTSLPMRRSVDGETWEIEVPLASGRYTYAFFVDGRVARDSAAAESANDGFGTPSSVVLVRGGGT